MIIKFKWVVYLAEFTASAFNFAIIIHVVSGGQLAIHHNVYNSSESVNLGKKANNQNFETRKDRIFFRVVEWRSLRFPHTHWRRHLSKY